MTAEKTRLEGLTNSESNHGEEPAGRGGGRRKR
jgi:hypothetical protein